MKKVNYDKYYLAENLFGEPYPELIALYSTFPEKGRLLDLGCGQGRDAVALARLGYEVTGIDHSSVGIRQLNEIAKRENLPLTGVVANVYQWSNFAEFDFILLDSMFHFSQKDKAREIGLLDKITTAAAPGTLLTICIQHTGKKLAVLNAFVAGLEDWKVTDRTELVYKFADKSSGHVSTTKYEMISMKKILMNTTIRPALPEDLGEVHRLIRQFAAFIKTPEKVKITPGQMLEDQQYFKCLVVSTPPIFLPITPGPERRSTWTTCTSLKTIVARGLAVN